MKARIPKNPEDLKARMVEVNREEPKADVLRVLRERENAESAGQSNSTTGSSLVNESSGNREKRRNDAKEVMKIVKKVRRNIDQDYTRYSKKDIEKHREIAERVIEGALKGKSYEEQLSKLIREFQKESAIENLSEITRYFMEPYMKTALYGRLDEIYIESVKKNNEEYQMFDSMMIASREMSDTINNPMFIKNEFKDMITTGDKKLATRLRKLLKGMLSEYSPLDNSFFYEASFYTQSGKKFWREDALMYTEESRNMSKFTSVDNYYRFSDLRKRIKVSRTGTNEEFLSIKKLIKEEFAKKVRGEESTLSLTDIAILAERESTLFEELNMSETFGDGVDLFQDTL